MQHMTVIAQDVNTGGNTGGQEPSSQLLAPAISLSGATQTNGYYTGNVIVTIEDSASVSTTKAVKVKYQVDRSKCNRRNRSNGKNSNVYNISRWFKYSNSMGRR